MSHVCLVVQHIFHILHLESLVFRGLNKCYHQLSQTNNVKSQTVSNEYRTLCGKKFGFAVVSKAISLHSYASPRANKSPHNPSDRVHDEATQTQQTHTHTPVHSGTLNQYGQIKQLVLGDNKH